MITADQVAVAGTVPLVTVPAGPSWLTVATTAGTAYVGPGSAVSAGDGFPVSTTPVTVPGWAASRAVQIYATASGTVTTCWLLSAAG